VASDSEYAAMNRRAKRHEDPVELVLVSQCLEINWRAVIESG
jgi:hypothetical protein